MSQSAKPRRRSRLAKAAVVLGSVAALTVGLAGSASAAAPNPLPYQASAFQEKYQPLFDYDHDGCYPSSAVDPTGWLNGGLRPVGNYGGDCRYMGRANTYVRSACDSTWCAYVYALYFEKDQGPFAGHTHDWEAAVVWQRRGSERPSYVAASAHGRYDIRRFSDVPTEGNRVKIVYHLQGQTTHSFRYAKWGERAEAWGDGGWDHPTPVAMDKLKYSNSKAFWALWNKDWNWLPNEGANFPLQDYGNHFKTTLSRSKPSAIGSFNPRLGF
jgi:hypothetical protein